MLVLKEQITKLHAEQKQAETKLKSINTAIKSLQDICTHHWKSDGNDSHKDYEKCIICGESRSI